MSDRVGIFWDYSSCPTSDTSDESSIALSLRKDCVQHGHVVLFKAYFGLPDSTPFEPPSESIRSKIEGVGVVTVDHPKAGFGAFSTDIFCFLMDNHELPVSTTIVLVSGNPDIAYLVSALYARGVRVGLVAPSGQLDKLSSQTSWTENWDNYTVAFGSSSVVYHPSQSSTSLKRPSDTPVAPRRTKARYTTTLETIPQPLHQVQAHGTLCEPYLYTSSHKLQMFENDPLYIELIKDPEAIKVKTWRRELKQLFFYQDITTNVCF
ncbi:hypothetical protein OPQ81_004255 [Rhizoctonia solani]|nr:hypothetical protein OPQ81_004255 [Rhizoctonia solani]